MSYGKDPRQLAGVAPYRASIRQQFGGYVTQSRLRPQRKLIPYFLDMFRPVKGVYSQCILIPGDYTAEVALEDPSGAIVVARQRLMYFPFVEHYDHVLRKSTICSAGPLRHIKERRALCYGCDRYWDTLEYNEEGRRESTRISRQSKIAVSMVDPGPYHQVTVCDAATGEVRTNRQGQPYYNYERCWEHPSCEGCKAGLPVVMGHNPHWPMSQGYFGALLDYDRDVADWCRNCRNRSIASQGWVCANEKCKNIVIDVTNCSLSPEEIVSLTEKEPYACPRCGQKRFLKEEIECRACPKPARTTIWDLQLEVKQTEDGRLKVGGAGAIQFRPKLSGRLEQLAKPKDLARYFSPTPLKQQREVLNIDGEPIQGASEEAREPEARAPSRAYDSGGDKYQ